MGILFGNNSSMADFGEKLETFGDAIQSNGMSLMSPPAVKPGNGWNKLGHGLMAMGAGFQGGNAGAVVKNYRDGIERAQRKDAIAGLMGQMGIGQPQQELLATLPLEAQQQYLLSQMTPQASQYSRVRDMLAGLTADRASRLMAEAVTDPQLFRSLLMDASAPRLEKQVISRVLPYLVGGGASSLLDG